jgi:hypothetical protein
VLILGLQPTTGSAASAVAWPDGTQVYVGYHGNPDDHVSIQDDSRMGGRRFSLGSIYPGKQLTYCTRRPCIEDVDVLHTIEGGVTMLSILEEGRLGISGPKLGDFREGEDCDERDADPASPGDQGCDGKWGWDTAWKDVIGGKFDGWIQQQRHEIHSEMPQGGKIIITFHPEPIREGRAGLFRKAFAHVYRVFNTDAIGAWAPLQNVRWMWTFAGETSFQQDNIYLYREHDTARCPDQDSTAAVHRYCDDPDNGRMIAEAYYPQGVRDPADPCSPICHPVELDYGGMDPFSHNCGSTGNQTFRDIATEGRDFFVRKGLPFFVQETARGADDSGSKQADWIDTPSGKGDLYSTLKTWASAPDHLVMGFLWFDATGPDIKCDWNLSPQAIGRFGVFAADRASFKTL